MSDVGDPKFRLTSCIEALTPQEQQGIIIELADYAHFLISTHGYWISRSQLPRGYDAKSLALEAIARVLTGSRRDWDPEKEPTLTAYLKSVVKSIFSSEILPAAKRELPEVSSIDNSGLDQTDNSPAPAAGPDSSLIAAELKEMILAKLELEEDQLVLFCLFEDITEPVDIAAETGLNQKEIYRIKQKIKRRLCELKKEA